MLIIGWVIVHGRQMTDVINKEDNHRTLQTDLKHMGSLLEDNAILFRDQQEAHPEIVRIWLQLLGNSLPKEERLLSIDRSVARGCGKDVLTITCAIRGYSQRNKCLECIYLMNSIMAF